MKVKFIADSSSDMLDADFEDLTTVPLTISTDNESWLDENLEISEMLEKLETHKGRTYTACPGVASWLKLYEGADIIYVATITGALSGTYNSAMAAKQIFAGEHPEVKIHVFDTLSTAGEIRLLMEKLMELHRAGKSFEEVCREAQEYQKQTGLLFALKSLHNLAQNGRISKALASALGVLGISIIGMAGAQGTLQPIGKSRGDRKTINRLREELIKTGCRGGKLRISHVENEELAEQLREALTEQFPGADIQVYKSRGLCSYYAERGAVLIGYEKQ